MNQHDETAVTLTVHDDGTATLALSTDFGARLLDDSKHILVEDPDAPLPHQEMPLWEGAAKEAGRVLAPGTYTARCTKQPTDSEGAGTTMQDSDLATVKELADQYGMSTGRVVTALNAGALADDDAVDAAIAREILDIEKRFHRFQVDRYYGDTLIDRMTVDRALHPRVAAQNALRDNGDDVTLDMRRSDDDGTRWTLTERETGYPAGSVLVTKI